MCFGFKVNDRGGGNRNKESAGRAPGERDGSWLSASFKPTKCPPLLSSKKGHPLDETALPFCLFLFSLPEPGSAKATCWKPSVRSAAAYNKPPVLVPKAVPWSKAFCLLATTCGTSVFLFTCSCHHWYWFSSGPAALRLCTLLLSHLLTFLKTFLTSKPFRPSMFYQDRAHFALFYPIFISSYKTRSQNLQAYTS